MFSEHLRTRVAAGATAIALVAVGSLGTAMPAGAGTGTQYLQVTSGANSGPGTWRAAITAANDFGGPVAEFVITFDDGIRVELTGSDVAYTRATNLNIRGRGATLDGNVQTVPLVIDDNASVELERLTFVDGRNDSEPGGAIQLAQGADLAVYDTTFTGNQAVHGGALALAPDSGVQLTRTTLEDNLATGADAEVDDEGVGGAIFADGGYVDVRQSTLSGNQSGDDGGAVYAEDTLVVSNDSTFVGNIAGDDGGAIITPGTGEVQTYNSTLTGNQAADQGGAIMDDAGILFLNTSSFVDNSAVFGAHLFADQLSSIQNVFDGSFGGGESCALIGSTDDEYSWEDGDSCAFDPLGTSTSDGGSAALGALDDFGGPTQTYLPHPDSPLVDAIPEVDCETSQDQRGVDRPAGEGCDIGAVEAVGQTFTDVGFAHPFWLEVEWMAEEGISEGYLPGPTYKPGAAVTRQAMSAFLYRLAGEPAFADPADATFADVGTGHPFFTEVEWMAAEGISEGTPASPKPLYKPSAAVSRQAMSAFLYRYSDEDTFEPDGVSFTDVSETHPFYEAIEWMADTGISEGYDGQNGREYRPSVAVSRQAMSAFMYRYAHNIS
jgi:predicted outer membrane repeat protein